MAPNELTCPGCGSHRILNITLPAVNDAAHRTRGGHRCMDCATQWPAGSPASVPATVQADHPREDDEREDQRA
jgi:hypothetical protein